MAKDGRELRRQLVVGVQTEAVLAVCGGGIGAALKQLDARKQQRDSQKGLLTRYTILENDSDGAVVVLQGERTRR